MSSKPPLLVHGAAQPDGLIASAGNIGWRIGRVDSDCDDPVEELSDAALFVAADDAEARRFRRLCPAAVGIGFASDSTHVDIVMAAADCAANAPRVLSLAQRVYELHGVARTANDTRLPRQRMRLTRFRYFKICLVKSLKPL